VEISKPIANRVANVSALISKIDKEITALAKLNTVKSKVQQFADTHYAVKKLRDGLEVQRKKLYAIQERIEGEARAKYEKEGIEGARGEAATAYLQELDHYGIDDRTKLDRYIKKNGNFELLQNRVSVAAIEELMAVKPKLKLSTLGVNHTTSKHFRTRKR
jgi:hypothetical protein